VHFFSDKTGLNNNFASVESQYVGRDWHWLAEDKQGGRDWQSLADDEQVSGGTAEVGCCTDTSGAMSPSFLFFLWGDVSGILPIIDRGK